jgi:putative endonuclease
MHAGGSLEYTAMAYREKIPAVYILASKRNGTICTGVSSDLYVRIPQHKQGLIEGFTKKYNVHMLVYYEMHHLMRMRSSASTGSRNGASSGRSG